MDVRDRLASALLAAATIFVVTGVAVLVGYGWALIALGCMLAAQGLLLAFTPAEQLPAEVEEPEPMTGEVPSRGTAVRRSPFPRGA